ncbi:hypothetical protein LD118_00145 [Mesoplasma lactucae ATCC 49193]|uniref:Uncharacterized protein n=2 Tax=Mesoplasma lactucae TaxID=138853 RepID=A0A291IR07_9MOLU|nr:hypothetical protein CP520_00100 [Mesoplasma lactucae ATCC 49193]ATZ20392.1 hypothetical protein MLACT_v1c05710 [Mesoplasma lactucae ATCC 49193]MCL8216563.1 hypothetical protein [Mesoplasma lactucae ATCC 49193]
MLYLQTNNVLVEIKTITYLDKKENITKQGYLVGDKLFSHLPKKVLNNSFLLTNWNRALKYNVNEEMISDGIEIKNSTSSWNQIEFDLYLDYENERLKTLSKDVFANKIISQTTFQTTFLHKIIESYNKFKTDNDFMIDYELFSQVICQTVKQTPLNIDGDLVNKNFDLNYKKVKWNKIIKLGNETKLERTKNNQLVYLVNKDKINSPIKDIFKYINFATDECFCCGYVKIQNDEKLYLNLEFESDILISDLKEQVFKELKPLFNDSKEKYLHYYNITSNLDFLIEDLNQFKNEGYFETKNLLEQQFEEIKQNYYQQFYSENLLKQMLFYKVNTLSELVDYRENLTRYGVVSLDDKKEIDLRQKALNS